MKPTGPRRTIGRVSSIACVCLSTAALAAGPQSTPARPRPVPAAHVTSSPLITTFASPRKAADALIDAADRFDVRALEAMFGAANKDVIISGESAQDRQRAKDFVAAAREKNVVSVDRARGTRAFLLVGNNAWPFPIPIVKRGARWTFDTAAGRRELLYRRIGSNELDAIQICRGFVDAQHEYALQPREGYEVNQYAQRIISTPGTQDGLAWQKPDGTWGGPVGEAAARAIDQGYASGEPYHGYYFKVLKGQGPAAPLGQMDYVIKGVMIGGFALAAAPATYGVTGVKTFIVSHDGVVYEKDFGRTTSDAFTKLDRFNPDKSWTPVPED